jgi:hypothetical protein
MKATDASCEAKQYGLEGKVQKILLAFGIVTLVVNSGTGGFLNNPNSDGHRPKRQGNKIVIMNCHRHWIDLQCNTKVLGKTAVGNGASTCIHTLP